MWTKQWFWVVCGTALAVLAMVTLLPAAHQPMPAVDAASKTVRLAFPTEPPTLDPAQVTSAIEFTLLGHLMEGLLRYGAGNDVEPGVAESWTVNGTEVIFNLRHEARWADGAPVTAHDFVAAWRRALHPDTAAPYAYMLYPIKNGERVNTGDLQADDLGAVAVDDHTLKLILDRPVAHFETLLAFPTWLPVNADFLESAGDQFGGNANAVLSNGPFVLDDWVHGASLRMRRNPEYWEAERVSLEVVDYPYMTSDVRTAANLFADGAIAMAPVDAETLDLALERGWDVRRFSNGALFFLTFNHRPGRPTSNRNLRVAIRSMVDTEEFVQTIIKLPGTVPGASIFPRWLPGAAGGLFRDEYPIAPAVASHEVARERLEAGREELGGLPSLTLLINDSPTARRQAEYLQESARLIGLDVTIDAQVYKARLEKLAQGDFDLALAGWAPDYASPATFIDLVRATPNNHGRYANAEVERLTSAAALLADDPAQEMAAYDAIQHIVRDDVALLPLYEGVSTYVTNPRLTGVVRRSVGFDIDLRFGLVVDGEG